MSTRPLAIDIDDALIEAPRDEVFRDPPANVPPARHPNPEQKPPVPSATADAEEHLRTRAYQLWQERGSPDGSADEDWYQAQAELMSGQG